MKTAEAMNAPLMGKIEPISEKIDTLRNDVHKSANDAMVAAMVWGFTHCLTGITLQQATEKFKKIMGIE